MHFMHAVGPESGKIGLQKQQDHGAGPTSRSAANCGSNVTRYSTTGFFPLPGNVDGHIYAAAAAEVDCMGRISRNQFGRRFRIPGDL